MKHQSFKPVLFAAIALLSIVACKKDTVDEPAPGPVKPPQQELPNPLPAKALVSQLKWAENDHQTFFYNAKGQISQLRLQWQYVEGDPTKIRTVVDDFQYDTQDRPVAVNSTGGFSMLYFYHGNLIHRTKELYPGGALAKEVTYIYADNRIAQEVWHVSELPGEPVSVYKFVFGYDASGNLNKVVNYQVVIDSISGQQQDKLLETIEYSDFDDKINPTSWILRYPYLPQVRWQFNNPGREVRISPEGATETTTYVYEYNNDGLPVVRRNTKPSGVLTTNYLY